jgi:hypothetical protein
VTTKKSTSRGAERQRRSRARRQRGSVLVSFEVARNATDALVRHRLLDEADRDKSDAVAAAIIRIAARALGLASHVTSR